jgi:hypothetical protein
MKLSGWQRIGMVISILWLLAVTASGFDRIHSTFGDTIGNGLELPANAFNSTETPKMPAVVDCGDIKYDENYL